MSPGTGIKSGSSAGSGSAGASRLGPGVLFALFMLALSTRAGWGMWRESRSEHAGALEFPDEVQYWNMALSLHSGNGLVDELGFRATRMPLYPAFLSLFAGWERGAFAAKAAQWAVGALVAPLAALLAQAYFGRRVSLLAGLWCALDPFLIFFASLLLTETISITLLCTLWWIIACGSAEQLSPATFADSRREFIRWTAIASLSVLCVYARESTVGLVFVAMFALALLSRSRLRVIARCAITTAVLIASLIPWGFRNSRVTGEWCWLTTRAGISLYDGVGPGASGASDLADVKQSDAVRGLSEHAWNRYFLDESFRIMREDPARVVRLAMRKFGRMWNPFPNVSTHQSELERWVSVVWMSATMGLASCGAVMLVVGGRTKGNASGGRSETSPGDGGTHPVAGHLTTSESCASPSAKGRGPKLSALVLLLLPAIYFSALHALFVGSVRYRLAAMPMIEVLAAFAAVTIVGQVRRWNAAARRICAT